MIVVKYFGAITENTKTNEEKFPFLNSSLYQLLNELEQKYQLNKLTFSIAVNQKMVQDVENYKLNNYDVIALLPPFSGG